MTETNESLKDSLFIDEEEKEEELPPAMPEKLRECSYPPHHGRYP